MNEDAKKIETISKLIEDEIEAVKGYQKAIDSGLFKDDVLKKLAEIRDDEFEHEIELTNLLFR